MVSSGLVLIGLELEWGADINTVRYICPPQIENNTEPIKLSLQPTTEEGKLQPTGIVSHLCSLRTHVMNLIRARGVNHRQSGSLLGIWSVNIQSDVLHRSSVTILVKPVKCFEKGVEYEGRKCETVY